LRPISYRIVYQGEKNQMLMNSVEVHPKVSNNGHPMDGALVDDGLVWPKNLSKTLKLNKTIKYELEVSN
jgi:hypothetical protein